MENHVREDELMEVMNNRNNGFTNRSYPERNIALYLVLSIVTCGLFGLYWYVVLVDDLNTAVNKPGDLSGGMVLLLTIVTCGIFGFFWFYKAGEKVDYLTGNNRGSNSILYLILAIFGLSIVNYCLIQSELNSSLHRG